MTFTTKIIALFSLASLATLAGCAAEEEPSSDEALAGIGETVEASSQVEATSCTKLGCPPASSVLCPIYPASAPAGSCNSCPPGAVLLSIPEGTGKNVWSYRSSCYFTPNGP